MQGVRGGDKGERGGGGREGGERERGQEGKGREGERGRERERAGGEG